MSLESISRYSEESVKQCKELVSYIKKRQAVEAEYARSLAKVAQSFKLPPEGKKSQLMKTSLWRSFSRIIDTTSLVAESHRQFAEALITSIHDPFSQTVKEMEVARKIYLERGNEHNRNLQDAVTALRKARKECDQLNSSALEASNALTRAQSTPGTRDREMERLTVKAAQFNERWKHAQEAVKVHEDICNAAEVDYKTVALPNLLEEVTSKEEERCLVAKKMLTNLSQLEKKSITERVMLVENMCHAVGAIDVGEDMEEFLGLDGKHGDAGTKSQISVKSITNSIKSGKLYLRRGEVLSEWRPKFLVLSTMEGNKALFCFDNEDSIKCREIIPLRDCQVHPVDDSLFDHPNCLQIVVRSSSSHKQVYNLSADTFEERDEWLIALRYHSVCCPKCTLAFGPRETDSLRSRKNSVTGSQASKKAPVTSQFQYPALNANAYRVIRSVKVNVFEAKDLPGLPPVVANAASSAGQKAALAPYCLILLNEVKQARTTSMSGDAPFWGESYTLSDIAPHYTRLTIIIYHNGGGLRDPDIGQVSINLNALKPNQKIEEWFTLKSFPRSGSNSAMPHLNTSAGSMPFNFLHMDNNDKDEKKSGAIRLGITLLCEEILPFSYYEDYIQIIGMPGLTCLKALNSVMKSHKSDLSHSVLNVLLGLNAEVSGLKELLRAEIETTEEPNILFRGNTLGTKAMDHYLKVIGTNYLRSTLAPFVQAVLRSHDSCEIDPTKLTSGMDVKKNFKRLREFVNDVWEVIQQTRDKCPREFREIFGFISHVVAKKFPDNQYARYSAVSGFLFLRFFCPALLNPKLFGLSRYYAEPTSARTFTLVAKVIQNLANLAEFKKKEPYMLELNPFIQNNLESMKKFLDYVSPYPVTSPSQGATYHPPVDLRREAEQLYQHFIQNAEPLTDLGTKDQLIMQLCLALSDIENAHMEFEAATMSSSNTSGNGSLESISRANGSATSFSGISNSPPRLSLNHLGPAQFRSAEATLERTNSRKNSNFDNEDAEISENLDALLRNMVNSSFSFNMSSAESEDGSPFGTSPLGFSVSASSSFGNQANSSPRKLSGRDGSDTPQSGFSSDFTDSDSLNNPVRSANRFQTSNMLGGMGNKIKAAFMGDKNVKADDASNMTPTLTRKQMKRRSSLSTASRRHSDDSLRLTRNAVTVSSATANLRVEKRKEKSADTIFELPDHISYLTSTATPITQEAKPPTVGGVISTPRSYFSYIDTIQPSNSPSLQERSRPISPPVVYQPKPTARTASLARSLSQKSVKAAAGASKLSESVTAKTLLPTNPDLEWGDPTVVVSLERNRTRRSSSESGSITGRRPSDDSDTIIMEGSKKLKNRLSNILIGKKE